MNYGRIPITGSASLNDLTRLSCLTSEAKWSRREAGRLPSEALASSSQTAYVAWDTSARLGLAGVTGGADDSMTAPTAAKRSGERRRPSTRR